MNEQLASGMRSALYELDGEVSPEGIQELYDFAPFVEDPEEWLEAASCLDEEWQ